MDVEASPVNLSAIQVAQEDVVEVGPIKEVIEEIQVASGGNAPDSSPHQEDVVRTNADVAPLCTDAVAAADEEPTCKMTEDVDGKKSRWVRCLRNSHIVVDDTSG